MIFMAAATFALAALGMQCAALVMPPAKPSQHWNPSHDPDTRGARPCLAGA